MLCEHCNKPIVLVPSAEERARRFGGSPEYYRNLFRVHAHCQVEMRQAATQKLLDNLKGKKAA